MYDRIIRKFTTLKINANKKKQFLLILFALFILFLFKQYYNVKNNDNIYEMKSLSATEIKELLAILFYYEIFLMDVNLTKNIQLNHKTKLVLNMGGQVYSFGIFNKSVNLLNKLSNKFNKKCDYIQKNNIYIKCYTFITIQILIVYERGNFLWIDKDDFFLKSKQFADTPRALSKFELKEYIDENSNLFRIPLDLDRYLFDYDHSKFIECNSSLAIRSIQINEKKYEQNAEKNAKISKVIEYISEKLENFSKHYWLAGGSLLGWYRDCGIIPHTTDFDYAIWSHEYDDRIKNTFLGNHVASIVTIHGMVNNIFNV
jgi:hypothetical protein